MNELKKRNEVFRMKFSKKGLVFAFLILTSMVLGSMIAIMCKDIDALKFLSYSKSIGFENDSPMVIDLIIIKITLGISINISIAHAVTFLAAIFAYPKIVKNVE
ncbi:MAG TPA: DUF4321 domain-containing protein [Ruminococcus sp.]|nr:DUF4321 domain-containing protein [Ruminococcus sp.]HBN11724.1 DUF4321 domain-containing protein [Ruminococcus sp.]HCR74428.1 DUF4321 domain-containing protein [Ruminococcus sp.]